MEAQEGCAYEASDKKVAASFDTRRMRHTARWPTSPLKPALMRGVEHLSNVQQTIYDW